MNLLPKHFLLTLTFLWYALTLAAEPVSLSHLAQVDASGVMRWQDTGDPVVEDDD